MRNVLFSVRTKALLLDALDFAAFVGTIGFRATVERQMRLEFVRDQPLYTAFPLKPHVFASLYQVEANGKETS